MSNDEGPPPRLIDPFDAIRQLIDRLRENGYEDNEIGGALHGATIMLAINAGMNKSFFLGVADGIWERVAAGRAIATQEAVEEVTAEARKHDPEAPAPDKKGSWN